MLDRKIHQIRSQNVPQNNKIQQIILSLIWDKKKTVEISFLQMFDYGPANYTKKMNLL